MSVFKPGDLVRLRVTFGMGYHLIDDDYYFCGMLNVHDSGLVIAIRLEPPSRNVLILTSQGILGWAQSYVLAWDDDVIH